MFKEDLVDIGTVAPGSTTEVEWELTGSAEDVIHFRPDCGCTANIRTEGNKVIAEFTEEDAGKLTSKQKKDWYPSGELALAKGIRVYFKDGKDLFILNAQGRSVYNPEKLSYQIRFIGHVDIKDTELVE